MLRICAQQHFRATEALRKGPFITMIITFCGHSDFYETGDIRERLLNSITEAAGDEQVELYLGGYGNFDLFAHSCAVQYKKSHPSAKIILVTPYIDEKYLAARRDGYDEIIYPDLEGVPKRFAITYRNRWIIGKADTVIAYVKRSVGGAYQAYKHAIALQKNIRDLT